MNKWLAGNGYWCPACGGSGRGEARDRILYQGGGWCQFYDPCATCGGDGRLAASVDQIRTGSVPETRPTAARGIMSTCIEYGPTRGGG